jgi:hypothetical protein
MYLAEIRALFIFRMIPPLQVFKHLVHLDKLCISNNNVNVDLKLKRDIRIAPRALLLCVLLRYCAMELFNFNF